MIWPLAKPFKYNHFTTYTSYNAKITTEQTTGVPCALHLLPFALKALVVLCVGMKTIRSSMN